MLLTWLVRRLECFSGTANFDSSKDSLWAELSLSAINGRQKWHILADKQEHSSSIAAVLTQHNVARSAKIGQFLAESTKFPNGFDRPAKGAEQDTSSGNARRISDLSEQFRLGSNQKTAKTALSARLFRESHEFLRTITNTVKQEICGTDEITLSDKVEKG